MVNAFIALHVSLELLLELPLSLRGPALPGAAERPEEEEKGGGRSQSPGLETRFELQLSLGKSPHLSVPHLQNGHPDKWASFVLKAELSKM